MTNKPHSCNDPNCPAPSHDYPDGVEPAPSPQGPAPTTRGICEDPACVFVRPHGEHDAADVPSPAQSTRRSARQIAHEHIKSCVHVDRLRWPVPHDELCDSLTAAIERDRLAPVQGEAEAALGGEAIALLVRVQDFDENCQDNAEWEDIGIRLNDETAAFMIKLRAARDAAIRATQPPAPPVGTGGTTP